MEKYQIEDEVNIRLKGDYLIIEPINKPRAGWDLQFKEANSSEEHAQLLPDVFEEEDQLPWE